MRQNGIFAAAALHGARPSPSSASSTTTPTRASSPRRWRAHPAVELDLATRADQHRRVPPARRAPSTRRRWWRGRASAACCVNAFGARTVRAVTHLDVDRAQCEQAAQPAYGVARGVSRTRAGRRLLQMRRRPLVLVGAGLCVAPWCMRRRRIPSASACCCWAMRRGRPRRCHTSACSRKRCASAAGSRATTSPSTWARRRAGSSGCPRWRASWWRRRPM